jgi:diguanylate cyclase (GGDEF)-like protein/PAS domain S-box-containing protein
MRDQSNTKQALIGELASLKRRIAEMEQAEPKRTPVEETVRSLMRLIDAAPDSITVHDFDGNFLYANQKTFELHRYTREEFFAATLHDLDVPESEELIASRMQQILETGEASFEVSHFRKDGSTFPLIVHARIGDWNEKKVIFSIASNITERKQKEDEIQNISKLLAETQAITKVGGWEYDVATGRIKWTDEVYRIYGVGHDYDPSNVNRAISFYAPEDTAVIEKAFRQAMESGEPYDLELGFIRANGERIWVRTIGRPFIEDGKVVRIAGNIMDITERKQAEEALQSSNEMFSLYMHYSPIYTFIKDVTPTQSIVLQASDNYRQMIGVPGSQMVGKAMEDLFPAEFATKITEDDWAVVSKGDVLKLDEELNGRNYTTIKFPIIQRDRTLLAGYTIDITDRKRAEEALRESENRYRELSIHDNLTQLFNSRHFYHQLKMEIDRTNRYGHSLAFLLLDLDDFKAFNDTYGHVEGDQVLRRFGQVFKRCLRQTDSAYRYGGEEFTILMPMTTSEDGAITAERIRIEFKKETFSPVPGQDVHVTVSMGLAQYKPQEGIKAFVQRVDQLMYKAKKNGKDRVCCEP